MPTSSKICEKIIYLNCSESLWTDLVLLVKLRKKVLCYSLNKYAEYGGENSFVCQYGFVMLKVLSQYAKPYQPYKSEKMHVTVH